MDARDIKEELKNRLDRFCAEFLPGGHKEGHYYRCGGVNGGKGRSLVLHLDGRRKGEWYENNPDGSAAIEKGSILDLFMAVKGFGKDQVGEALKAAKEWCGIYEPQIRRISGAAKGAAEPPQKFMRKYQRWPVQEDSEVGKYLLGERGIPLEILRKYNVCEGLVPWQAGEDGKWIQLPTVVFEFQNADGEYMGSKYLALRRDEKGGKMIRAESGMDEAHQHIWGMKAVPKEARELVICEGEIDAMSAAACGFSAVSIPFGAKGDSNRWIENDFEWLDRFEVIKLCGDNDDAGRRQVEAMMPRLNPLRCEIVKVYEPFKDANELYLDNPDYLKTAIEDSEAKFPEKLRRAKDFGKEIWREFFPPDGVEPGFELPFNCKEFRVRPGEVSVITGLPKGGKTNFINWLINCFAARYGARTGITSLEIKAQKTLRNLMRQAMGKRKPMDDYGRPDKTLFSRTLKFLDEHFFVFDGVGRAKLQEILDTFSWAVRKYGLDILVIDSLMKLDVSKENLDRQAEVMDMLCCWARDNNVHVFLVAHSRKPQNKDNRENHVPRPEEVEGSGDITKQAHNTIVVHRNWKKSRALAKAKGMNDQAALDDLRQEYDALVWVALQREGDGEEAMRHLFFDTESWQYGETPDFWPISLLDIYEDRIKEDA